MKLSNIIKCEETLLKIDLQHLHYTAYHSFLIIVGLVFSIYWLMWAYYMMFIMYTGMMSIGFGGFLLFYLYMNKVAYYNKP